MTQTLSEKLLKNPESQRLYEQEQAILELTEMICQIMAEQNVSRSELAERLGKTKGYVTQLLDGKANMTIRTIVDIFSALEHQLHFDSSRAKKASSDRKTNGRSAAHPHHRSHHKTKVAI